MWCYWGCCYYNFNSDNGIPWFNYSRWIFNFGWSHKRKTKFVHFGSVTIQNTGNQSITNITVDYGDADKDFIPTLQPGETMIMSPPGGNSLQFVRVTADGDIDIYMAYREPVAMPGMMGSWFTYD